MHILMTAVQHQSCKGPSRNFDAVDTSPDLKVKLLLAAHSLDLPGSLLSTNWNLHEELGSTTVQIDNDMSQLGSSISPCAGLPWRMRPSHSVTA